MTMPTGFVESINSQCLSNDYISQCIREFLRKAGYRIVRRPENSDVVIVTGCNVMDINPQVAENYARFAHANPSRKVILTGCTPGMESRKKPRGGNFYVIPYGRLVRKPRELDRILNAKIPFRFLNAGDVLPGRIPFWAEACSAGRHCRLCHIVVSDGCLGSCAFCAIKQAKGRVKSVPLSRILSEFEAGLERGIKDFWLQSDDTGCWGMDMGLDISVLLGKMAVRYPSARLFLQINPSFFLSLFPKLKRLLGQVRFLLIPIQSGNNRMIRLMNRDYDIGKVLDVIEKAKKLNPDMFIATEVIAGFPTETREEFMDSIHAAVRFDAANFAPMTIFPHTPAAALGGKIEKTEIKRRLEIARVVGKKIRTHEIYDTSSVEFPPIVTTLGKDKPPPVVWIRKKS